MRRSKNIENAMVLMAAWEAGGPIRETISVEEARRNAYRTTEARLSDMRMVRERIKDTKQKIKELETLGVAALGKHSASFVSILKPGMRLTPEEVHEEQLERLYVRLTADEREIRMLDVALELIRDDPYYPAIELYYERNLTDAEVAEKMNCDRSTVARRRRRLVSQLTARLEGL